MSNNYNKYSELDRAKELIEKAKATHAPNATKNTRQGNLAVNSAETSFGLGLHDLLKYLSDIDDVGWRRTPKPVIGHPLLQEVANLIEVAEKRKYDEVVIEVNGNDANGNNQNWDNANWNNQNGNSQNGNSQNGNSQNGNSQNGNNQNWDDENGNENDNINNGDEAHNRNDIFFGKINDLKSSIKRKFQVGFRKNQRGMSNILSIEGNNNNNRNNNNNNNNDNNNTNNEGQGGGRRRAKKTRKVKRKTKHSKSNRKTRRR